MQKIKIVLDADVIIHFSKGYALSLLPEIFPNYDYIVLSIVYDEIKSVTQQLDNQIRFIGNISLAEFQPTGDMKKEYANLLRRNFGREESACMTYCRYTNNALGSSNLKDIKDYCEEHNITYLTTIDFLYYAYKKNMMTENEIQEFITNVNNKGSHLPIIDITKYQCRVNII